MRVIIITCGLVVLVGCITYSMISSGDQNAHSFAPINIGYFIVIAGAFISAALFRDSKQKHSKVRYEVYRKLSGGGLPMDDLMEALSKELLSDLSGDKDRQILRVTVSTMLDKGRLVCTEGTINVAEQVATSDRTPR